MAGEDPDRLTWCRAQRCAARNLSAHTKCQGPIQPHHPTFMRATGDDAKRAHDDTAIPLCALAHRCLHDVNGAFKLWDKQALHDWQTVECEIHKALYVVYLSQRQSAEGGIPF